MDSWEWNKIAGAVLGTLIFILVITFATEAVFEPQKPVKEAYHVEGVAVASTSGSEAAAPVEEALPDWGTALPTADVAGGKAISARCEQCHDISKGGPNKIGPELYGVVMRPRATNPGFSYSTAMSASHDAWSYDNLFKFTKSPQSYVPGTKMTFTGLRSPTDRINLIAFLRTQNDSPPPIPAPAPAKAAAAAPAGGAPTGTAPAGATPAGAAPATPPKK